MEWIERPTTAEECAAMFKSMNRQASAHVCADSTSVVRCVDDGDTAWAAPGGNADGLQLELAGFARQTKAQWLDPYGKDMLNLAAKVCAAWCTKYKVPVVKLTHAGLKAGKKGFVSHADISAVYKRSDHTDPGRGFPWAHFLERVRFELSVRDDVPKPEDRPKTPTWPGRNLAFAAGVPTIGDDVRTWQRRMRTRGWVIAVDGIYGALSRDVCERFQAGYGLYVDGIVGPDTWLASWEIPVD